MSSSKAGIRQGNSRASASRTRQEQKKSDGVVCRRPSCSYSTSGNANVSERAQIDGEGQRAVNAVIDVHAKLSRSCCSRPVLRPFFRGAPRYFRALFPLFFRCLGLGGPIPLPPCWSLQAIKQKKRLLAAERSGARQKGFNPQRGRQMAAPATAPNKSKRSSR